MCRWHNTITKGSRTREPGKPNKGVGKATQKQKKFLVILKYPYLQLGETINRFSKRGPRNIGWNRKHSHWFQKNRHWSCHSCPFQHMYNSVWYRRNITLFCLSDLIFFGRKVPSLCHLCRVDYCRPFLYLSRVVVPRLASLDKTMSWKISNNVFCRT